MFSVLIFFSSFFLPHSNYVCWLKRARFTAACPPALPVTIRDTSLVEGLVYGLQCLCEEATMVDEEIFLGMRKGRSTNLCSWYVYTVGWRQKMFVICCINLKKKSTQTENHNTPVAQGKVSRDNAEEDLPLGSPRIVCSARNVVHCTGWHKLDCTHTAVFVGVFACGRSWYKCLWHHPTYTWLTDCTQRCTSWEAGSFKYC